MRKNFVCVLAALIALVGCEKNNEIDLPQNILDDQESCWYFVSAKPGFADETKTAWTGSKVEWVAGDQIRVACYNSATSKWQSQSGDLSSGGKCYTSNQLKEENIVEGVATFEFASGSQFAMPDGNYRFYAFYPKQLNGDKSDISAAPIINNASLSNIQSISSSSFGSVNDILVGISKNTYNSKPAQYDQIELLWKRVVAFPVITFKNLKDAESGELVKSVTITAQDDAVLAGGVDVNIMEGTISGSTTRETYNYVTASSINGVALDDNNSFTSWFTTLPFTATSLKVDIETSAAFYSRTIDLSSNQKTFECNKRNLLTINMSTATREAKSAPVDGDCIMFSADTDAGTAASISKGGIALTNAAGAFNYADGYRFYANSTLSITSEVGNISKIELLCTATGTEKYGPGNAKLAGSKPGTYNYTSDSALGIWEKGNSETASVSFLMSAQVRTISIKVYYEPVATLESISITTPPTKVKYHVGESFDKTGLVVMGTYSNESQRDVTDICTFSPNGPLTTDDTAITVSCGDVAPVSQSITVLPAYTMSALAVKTNPTKMSYYVGEAFDPTGLVLTATYSDTESTYTEDITDGYEFTPTTFAEEGTKSIAVSFGGQTATIEGITVEAAPEYLAFSISGESVDIAKDAYDNYPVSVSASDEVVWSVSLVSGDEDAILFTEEGKGSDDINVVIKANTGAARTFVLEISTEDLVETKAYQFTINQAAGSAPKWTLVTDASSLKAGDKVVFASSSKGVTAGDISSSIMASVESSFNSDKSEITSLGSDTVVLTLGGKSGEWTFANSKGELLGATSVKKVAWDLGTTTWSISISDGNATIQNGTDANGRFLYNVGSPRFAPYTSYTSATMLLPQIYKLQ